MIMKKVLGQALREEREARGITLEKIAKETNLSMRYLAALENEDLKSLPADFYVRYYIKGYLRCIGADEKAFFEKYSADIEGILHNGKGSTPREYLENVHYSKFRKGRMLIAAAAVLAAVLALAFARPWRWLGAGAGGERGLQLPRDSYPYYLPEDRFAADFHPVNVSISFKENCWLSVARGREKAEGKEFSRGQVYSNAGYRLTITVGNPRAVEILVNGRKLKRLGQQGTALTLTLTPDSLPEIFKNYGAGNPE